MGLHPTGFEPVTCGSVDRCSIQLSYGCEMIEHRERIGHCQGNAPAKDLNENAEIYRFDGSESRLGRPLLLQRKSQAWAWQFKVSPACLIACPKNAGKAWPALNGSSGG